MHKFERNYKKGIDVICKVILWGNLLVLAPIMICIMHLSEYVTVESATMTLTIFFGVLLADLVIAIVAGAFVPDDFNYIVEVKNGFLIFSWSEKDRRVMQSPFTAQINGKEITLYDGNAVITVPYDKKVMEFLKGLNE